MTTYIQEIKQAIEICHSLNSEELHRYQVAVPHEKNITTLKVPTQ